MRRLDRVDAVLLDMGGVLIPEVADYSGALRDPMLRTHLVRLGVSDPAHLVLDAGRRVREAYRAAEQACTQPDPEQVLAHLTADVRRVLLRAFASVASRPPFDYALGVVARLARFYRLGLVSNTVLPGDHHARRLETYGLLRHFGSACWSANFGVRKPDPAILRTVLHDLGVPPHRALFVGDKVRTDVLAAARAGVASVWIRGDRTLAPDGPRPDFVIRDLRRLPELLRCPTYRPRIRSMK